MRRLFIEFEIRSEIQCRTLQASIGILNEFFCEIDNRSVCGRGITDAEKRFFF